jgi:uncharacterized linocin/CFP29 family protein
MTDFLHRDDAPFSQAVWERIDLVVTEAAKSVLSARRIIHIEGPYGLGIKSVPGPDAVLEAQEEGSAGLSSGGVIPLGLIHKTFGLSARDIAAFEQTGMPFSPGPAAQAAIACAAREDDLLFSGSKALGASGLLNAKGVQSANLAAWDKVGAAAEDLIKAATMLDEAGFHGPYALALAPARYNLLFRRYEQGNLIEIEHLRALVTDGIVKAPALSSGGVLLASGRQFATIVLGQDLMTGFVGPADGGYELNLSESLALRLVQPKAVCVLK